MSESDARHRRTVVYGGLLVCLTLVLETVLATVLRPPGWVYAASLVVLAVLGVIGAVLTLRDRS